jgi:ABC-type multidrug transport system ATPase subunit
MPSIRVFQLHKSYHHFSVLEEINLELEEGECFALFGRNGAGKTTLLKILSTLEGPTSGGFELMGFDGVKDRYKARQYLMLIAHGSFLYNDLDALENIRFAMALRGLSPTGREVKLALDRVEIGAFSRFKIRHYSEGMKKRLAIAKAMLARPRLIFMDEPYASLDERGMSTVNDFIRTMAQSGSTIFMTSHNRVKSAEVTQRVGVLTQGRLREPTVKELEGADEIY